MRACKASKLFGVFHLSRRFKYCQTCSIAFDSGQWGGWNIKIMLSGTCSFLALWKPPLSNWIIKISSGKCFETSSKKIWKHFELRWENSKKRTRPRADDRRKGTRTKTGYPKFKKNTRSVEYKQSGWKLDTKSKKHITFTDKNNIGRLKLIGSRDIYFYQPEQIKRVRIVRRADGYYCQFCISIDVKEHFAPTGKTIGLDVGLKEFVTDSNGDASPNPRFYRKSEKRLKKAHRKVSKKKKGSTNRRKAVNKLARQSLKISRQRKDHAVKLARCVIKSNDLVAYEDLRIKNLVKNHCLAKSINDAGWYQFRLWLEYFGKKFDRITVAVPPQYTSQKCSDCGAIVKKSLSTRTHICSCGCRLDRDQNAAINILDNALSTVGHTGTSLLSRVNVSGDPTAIVAGGNTCDGKLDRWMKNLHCLIRGWGIPRLWRWEDVN